MIDLIHNERTGFALVHDDAALEDARRALIGSDGGIRIVESSGRMRRLPRRIPSDLLGGVLGCATMPLIRVRGRRAVAVGDIAIFRDAAAGDR